jgi:hypothetical protein
MSMDRYTPRSNWPSGVEIQLSNSDDFGHKGPGIGTLKAVVVRPGAGGTKVDNQLSGEGRE